MRSPLTPVLLLCAMIVAACSGSPPATSTPGPTATLGPTPTAAPTPSPTPTAVPPPSPTEPPLATPTAAPSPSPSPASDGAFPNEAEALLISYADPDLQASCMRRDEVYPTEVDSVSCGPEDLPFDYSLFSSLADMGAAYDRDLQRGEIPPQPDGTCAEANYETAYDIDGRPTGQVNCRQHHSSSTGDLYHVIEWTDDSLLVIGYISNRADLRSWDDLITFWQDQAGPFAP